MSNYIQNLLRKGLTENYERLDSVKFPPKTYIDTEYNFSGTLTLLRNTVGGEYMGSRFGQDVEPVGYYAIQKENTMMDHIDSYETSEFHIQKPIVIDISNDKRIQWKHDLSEMFGGSIRKRLSNKLKRLGYDSIITTDSSGETWEIVIL